MRSASSVRRALGLLAVGTLGMSTAVLGSLGVAQADPSGFTFTSDDVGTITVPEGTCAIQWTVIGAWGGADTDGNAAAAPAERRVTTTVTEGQEFTLAPGTAGASFADGSVGGTNPAYEGAFDGQAGNTEAGGGGGGGAASVVLEGDAVYLHSAGSVGAGTDGGAYGYVEGPFTDAVVADPDTDFNGFTENAGPDGLITGTGVACTDSGGGDTLAPPLAPYDLYADGGDGEVTVTFSESYPEDDATAWADSYEYRVGAGAWTPADTETDEWSSELHFTITGLTNGTPYSIRVRAVSETAGPGNASGAVVGTPYLPLHAPTGITATTAPSALNITWNPPAAGGTYALAGYHVIIAWTGQEAGGIYEPCDTDAATRTCFAGVPAGESYRVFVIAVDSEGNWGEDPDGVQTGVVPLPEVPQSVPVASAPLDGVTEGAALTNGQTVTIRGEGFLPNSTIQAVIYSTPTLLGSFDTDESGAFEIQVVIPDGLHAGEHSLVVSGLDENGNPRYLRTDVTVSASGGLLAYTGASVVGPAIGGLAAVVVGTGLLVLSRRRKTV